MFFKSICANEGISLESIKIFIDRTSNNEGKALQHVATHIQKEHVGEWLAVSQEAESPKDEYGMERRMPRKKINLHFTLISNEYHLCNLNDVHHRSPNQSPLRPIEMLRTTDRSHAEIRTEYDDELSLLKVPITARFASLLIPSTASLTVPGVTFTLPTLILTPATTPAPSWVAATFWVKNSNLYLST
jgi:hypothetical protein